MTARAAPSPAVPPPAPRATAARPGQRGDGRHRRGAEMIQYLLLLMLVMSSAKSEPSKLTDFAAYIANSQFEHHVPTSVAWRRSSSAAVAAFLAAYRGAVWTRGPGASEPEAALPIVFRQAVLFLASCEEFSYFLTKMDNSTFIPSKVIALFTEHNDNPRNLSFIMQAAWDSDVTDIIVMKWDNARRTVDMFTYYPYSRNKDCGDTSAVPVSPRGSEYFPPKFNDFNRCPFTVQSNGVPPYNILECYNGRSRFLTGIFGDYITMITSQLNATLVVTCSHSKVLPERRLQLLTEKEIDMALVVYVTQELLRFTQLAPVQYFSVIAWCGPPRREVHVWAKVIIPMLSNVSALLLASFVTFVLVLKIIHKFEPCKKKKSPKLLWQTWAIFMGQAANYISKSTLMNALFAVWIWFCLVVSILYQGELVRGLQTRQLEPPLVGLHAAIRAVGSYGGSRLMFTQFNGTRLGEKFTALDHYVAMSQIPEIANGKRFLLISDMVTMKTYTSLQCLLDAVTLRPTTMAMRPRWGGARAVSRLARRARDAGLLERLLRGDAAAARRLVERRQAERRSNRTAAAASTEVAPLDLVTLSTCFYSLAIMWVVCFIILWLELLYKRFSTPPLKNKVLSTNMK